jgi:hypothetical protein
MNKKVLLAIAMLFLTLASIVVEFFTVGMFMKAQAAKSWPKAAGTVTKSVVMRKESGKIQYVADVQYEYTVDDKKYQNDVVRVRGNSTDSKSTVEKIVSKYPVESKIDVYYDKSDSSDALLEPGADFVNYIIMISPLFFAGLFGLGAYGSWNDRTS